MALAGVLVATGCGGTADRPARQRAVPAEPGCYAFDPAAEGLACDVSNPILEPFVCVGGVDPGLECTYLLWRSVDGQERSSFEPGHPEQQPDPAGPVWRCCNAERPIGV